MSDVLPRLRPVEAFPVEHEGQRMIALRDPSGYTPSVVLLPGPLLEIVSLFDGDHTVIDVQATVMRQHGELVTAGLWWHERAGPGCPCSLRHAVDGA